MFYVFIWWSIGITSRFMHSGVFTRGSRKYSATNVDPWPAVCRIGGIWAKQLNLQKTCEHIDFDRIHTFTEKSLSNCNGEWLQKQIVLNLIVYMLFWWCPKPHLQSYTPLQNKYFSNHMLAWHVKIFVPPHTCLQANVKKLWIYVRQLLTIVKTNVSCLCFYVSM